MLWIWKCLKKNIIFTFNWISLCFVIIRKTINKSKQRARFIITNIILLHTYKLNMDLCQYWWLFGKIFIIHNTFGISVGTLLHYCVLIYQIIKQSYYLLRYTGLIENSFNRINYYQVIFIINMYIYLIFLRKSFLHSFYLMKL